MTILTTRQQPIESITFDAENLQNNGSYNIENLVKKALDHAGPSLPQLFTERKIAVISGAGIAGLAAAFKLNAHGYNVLVFEKRCNFSRNNIINLNMEVQSFLKKFSLLEEFEASVGARIESHEIAVFNGKENVKGSITNVSELQFEKILDCDLTKFSDFFKEDGIYSTQIKDLQAFLAYKATQLGIQILSNCEIEITDQTEEGYVSEIQVVQKDNFSSPSHLKPDLLFIAEGVHSKSAQKLTMMKDLDIVENTCTGENWLFGNLHYHGDKTFVLSLIITTKKTQQIANVIFNGKRKIVNVAVTSNAHIDKEGIHSTIQKVAKRAFKHVGIQENPEILQIGDKLCIVENPVLITNRIASTCSKGNVFLIGDAVGNSSPLAGLGGTLGLALTPLIVAKLLDDIMNGSGELHHNFKMNSQGYVYRWIEKSVEVKQFINNIFEKTLLAATEPKDPDQKKEIDSAN